MEAVATALRLFLSNLLLSLALLAILSFLLPLASRALLSLLWLRWDTQFSWPDQELADYNPSPPRPFPHLKSLYYKHLKVSSYGAAALPPAETAECAVCLCGVEAGDEIRELGCSHVFHRACLDRWVEHGRVTCPLCRRSLLRLRLKGEKVGDEYGVHDEGEMDPSTGLLYMVCLRYGRRGY